MSSAPVIFLVEPFFVDDDRDNNDKEAAADVLLLRDDRVDALLKNLVRCCGSSAPAIVAVVSTSVVVDDDDDALFLFRSCCFFLCCSFLLLLLLLLLLLRLLVAFLVSLFLFVDDLDLVVAADADAAVVLASNFVGLVVVVATGAIIFFALLDRAVLDDPAPGCCFFTLAGTGLRARAFLLFCEAVVFCRFIFGCEDNSSLLFLVLQLLLVLVPLLCC